MIIDTLSRSVSCKVKGLEMIRLQPLEHFHGGRILQLMDSDICRMLERPPITQVSEAIAYVYEFSSTQPVRFAITHPGLGIVGVISFGRTRNTTPEAVIGYWVGRSYQGYGFACQAVHLLLSMLKKIKVKKVIAEVLVDNTPSMKVLDRVGFTCLTGGFNGTDKRVYHFLL